MPTLTLPGSVKQADAGLRGFDANQVLSAKDADSLKSSGYDFCIRYMPRTAALASGNLTNAEATIILNAGLALMAVQHVALPGWSPTSSLGDSYGEYAAIYAKNIVGLPVGINIWCDLEEVAQTASLANIIAYCKAWYNAVLTAGYVPGLYVGYGTLLTPQQLYNDLPFQHYWRAYNGPDVTDRGYQLVQHTQQVIAGVTIDPNTTQNDHLGGTVFWLTKDTTQNTA